MRWMPQQVRGSFTLKVALAVVLIVVGDVLFFQQARYGGAFGLYGLLLLGALALAQPAVLRQRIAAIALALAAVYALAMLYSASLLAWLLFWIAAGLALLLPRTARFDDGWRWFQRLVFHGLVALAGPLPDLLRQRRVRAHRRPRSGGTRRLLPVLMLPLAGTLTFVWLFALANPVIAEWVASLRTPRIDGMTILRVVLWLVLAWLAWGLLRPHPTLRLVGTFDGSGDLAIPGVSPASVLLSLAAFNLLFLLQNAMDAAWLWGLAPLPEGLTLAAYAHRGAYPLIATALLAALFVLVALRPGSATAGISAVRRLLALWIAQNLFLVFNAGWRTVDYIEAYSLTVLRIAALLWMALVAVGLALIWWRIAVAKSAAWLINANLAAAGVLLSAVAFVDLGVVAAQWNVRHAREIDGDGAQLDLCYLNRLGGSALLPLIELEGRALPAPLRQQVRNARGMVHRGLIDEVAAGGWDWLSQYRLDEARRRLGGANGVAVTPYAFRCDGTPHPPPPEPAPPPSPLSAPPTPAAALGLTAAPQR